jgi:biotin-(acetyl-CoA carboxylase) ligase
MMTAARKQSSGAGSLDLPPAFDLVTLREAGDAFRYALALPEKAAGTLIWARRFQLAEFAVVLEPAEPLGQARLAFFAAMNALADTLAVHCPPEKPVAFAWPDTILLDGGILGGGRLAWSEACREDETPDWLIFGAMLRTASDFRAEPGEWMRGVALAEEGVWDVQPADIVESFARHLMSALHDWTEFGPQHEVARWMERFHRSAGSLARLDEAGNLCEKAGTDQGKRLLPEALAKPSWLDPRTGEPWL